MSLGIEYNPLVDEVGPLANWVAVTETDSRPAVIFGTSSDRIGTPDGRAYYVTLSKDLESLTGVPLAPYAGVAYGTFEDSLRAIAGMRVRLPRGFALGLIWDGRRGHPSVEYRHGAHVFSVIWVGAEDAGASWSVAF